jgi:hypothetical protein
MGMAILLLYPCCSLPTSLLHMDLKQRDEICHLCFASYYLLQQVAMDALYSIQERERRKGNAYRPSVFGEVKAPAGRHAHMIEDEGESRSLGVDGNPSLTQSRHARDAAVPCPP